MPARSRRFDARAHRAYAPAQVVEDPRTARVRRRAPEPTDALRTRLSIWFTLLALVSAAAAATGAVALRQGNVPGAWSSLLALALLPVVALSATSLLAVVFKLLKVPTALALPTSAAFSALAFVTGALLSAWAVGLEVALGGLDMSRHVFSEAGALLTTRLSELTGLSALHLSAWWLVQLGCVVFLALVLSRRCMRGRSI